MPKDSSDESSDDGKDDKSYTALFKANRFPAITYILMFSLVGMATSYIGPCLETMRCQLHATESFMTLVFGVQLFTVLLGTIFSGFLNKIIGADCLLAVSGSLLILSTSIFGLFHSVSTFMPILAVNGVSTGFIDNLCNIQMINLFGEKVGPFMQAMHFMFAFSAFIVLIISGPFISEGYKSCKEMEKTFNGTQTSVLTPLYGIISGLEAPAVICIIVMAVYGKWTCTRYRHNEECSAIAMAVEHKSYSDPVEKSGETPEPKKETSLMLATGILIIAVLMVFVAEGIQGEYNGFVFEYAIKVLKTDEEKQMAGYLTSTYWGSFALGRLITIFVATKVKTSQILVVDLIGLTIATLPLIVVTNSIITLYMETCLLGLFLSNAVPGVITLAEEMMDLSIFNVGSKVTALVMGSALGEACIPLLVGTLVNEVKPLAFPLFNFAIIIWLFILYVILVYLGSLTDKGLFAARPFSSLRVKS